MGEFGKLDLQKEVNPFFIYKRLLLNSPTAYFLHQIDYGFWYVMRKIHIRYPEIDVTGAVFGPRLSVELYQRGGNQWPQNVPIPVDLFCTPGMSGVTIDGAARMTAVPVKNAKLQNIIYPFRDNFELYVSGQNLVTPTDIDIMIIGFMVPVESQYQWEGSFNNG
jgi:hypothetical protein